MLILLFQVTSVSINKFLRFSRIPCNAILLKYMNKCLSNSSAISTPFHFSPLFLRDHLTFNISLC
jgi:hypothetical protein